MRVDHCRGVLSRVKALSEASRIEARERHFPERGERAACVNVNTSDSFMQACKE